MLELDRMLVTYPDYRLAATLRVPTGAHVAVVGPSGAGKSTFLAAIAGFEASEGRVLWDGEDLAGARPGARPFSMLFQDNNLFPHLTTFENVALGIAPSLRLTAAEKARVALALARVGLTEFEARKPAQLSGGQQGRVAIARVLVQGRALILLDEPFAALGPALRAEMLELVRSTAQESGATVLLVTHDLAEAARMPLMILVANGVAEAPAESAALLADPTEALKGWMG
jgi:thiamine transport system ATP-binding protein